jgi:hypothetical protein
VGQAERVTEQNKPSGLHIDGFAGFKEATPPTQLLKFNGGVGSQFAQGNQMRTDVGTLLFSSMDPQSVFCGCYLVKGTINAFGIIPDGGSLLAIDGVANGIRELARDNAGALANQIACTITAKVTKMAPLGANSGEYRLEALRRDGFDTKTFAFKPDGIVVMGQGTKATKVQEFNLRDERWKAVTQIEFDRKADGLVLGNAGLGSAAGCIDGFKAVGRLRQ